MGFNLGGNEKGVGDSASKAFRVLISFTIPYPLVITPFLTG
jgi:hypothetical protein